MTDPFHQQNVHAAASLVTTLSAMRRHKDDTALVAGGTYTKQQLAESLVDLLKEHPELVGSIVATVSDGAARLLNAADYGGVDLYAELRSGEAAAAEAADALRSTLRADADRVLSGDGGASLA